MTKPEYYSNKIIANNGKIFRNFSDDVKRQSNDLTLKQLLI